MERKIGEIFELDGDWYQCIESDSCGECSLFTTECGSGTKSDLADKVVGQCSKVRRTDNKHVIFKKLEKVGEPIQGFQRYKLAVNKVTYSGKDRRVMVSMPSKTLVYIEIKQTKEDMEEKKIQLKQEDIDYLTRKIRYLVYKTNDYDRATEEIMNLFIPSDTEHSSSEKIGKNLKSFDLETAKAGKPVCTRDGRKARIICFDRRLFYKNVSYPILAVVERSDREDDVCGYNEKGKVLIEDGAEYKDDLMMLPEKKEGWINVYKDSVYDTKDDALIDALIGRYESRGYIDTIKVSWSE